MYKFRFKNLNDMHDNIHGPLDVASGTETIDTHITTADNRHFSLLAIIKREEGGQWHLLKNPNNTPQTTGDLSVPTSSNAMVIMLYTQDGGGGGKPGVSVYSFAAPTDLSFVVGNDDDVTIEGTVLPVVIAGAQPPAAWGGGNFVDSFNPAVQTTLHPTITLKPDSQMGGTLSSIISLVDGNEIAPGPHTINYAYREQNAYFLCYEVAPVHPPDLNKQVVGAINVWLSDSVLVDGGGFGIVNGHVIHVPGNNPLSQLFAPFSKEIKAQYNNLFHAFVRLNEFSMKHTKELNAISQQSRVAGKSLAHDINLNKIVEKEA